LKGRAMIWFTAAVTLFLFAYLLVALLRPEWF
jgi:K+-transporting ATPase KdpF subunit